MQIDPDQVCHAFPWVKELWLLGPRDARHPILDFLVVSALPPKEVLPGQRKRLLSELQGQSPGRIDLHLTTSDQLSKWLARGGRFATTFRRQAVKLFERPPKASSKESSTQ